MEDDEPARLDVPFLHGVHADALYEPTLVPYVWEGQGCGTSDCFSQK
jgi:hypothetical protein